MQIIAELIDRQLAVIAFLAQEEEIAARCRLKAQVARVEHAITDASKVLDHLKAQDEQVNTGGADALQCAQPELGEGR